MTNAGPWRSEASAEWPEPEPARKRAPSRVIVVSDFASINGGQSKVAVRSARLLADAGHEVVFFAACGPVDGTLCRDHVRTICLNQKDILAEPNRGTAALRGIWNTTAARELRAVCDRSDPHDTIVHCHGFAKALSPSIGPVLTQGPIPSVYTMHEYFLACPNGGFFDFRRNEICHRKPLGISCLTTDCDVRHPAHKVWRVARQAMGRSFGRMPSGLKDVIYISELQRTVIQDFLSPDTTLHYVPNPTLVDGRLTTPAANDVFLFIGRLSPEKGCRLFAEAAREAGVRAVFAGDGPERSAVEQINPDALVTGWLSAEKVQQWIEKARCLVFPSLWYECQPLAPMEALARGVPVICGTWSAAAEVVEDGKTGLHVFEPSVDQLVKSIRMLRDGDHPVFSTIRSHPIPLTSDRAHLERLTAVYAAVLDARDTRQRATS
jgi:glycosyltransferase involved in cell wall biosynthesis